MKIRNLDTFYWIANLNSFRAAAEHLNVTQPAITARIQVLEQDLGTAVFQRDTRNTELTAAGRDLLPYATKMMELDQSVINRFSDTTTAEQSVRLGASETVVGSWLPDFLSNYAQMRPNLSFDLTVDATNNLRNALVARELDLAFLMGPIAEASIENVDLCGYDMVFAAAPKIAIQSSLWDAASLADQGILTFSANTRPYRYLRELLSPHTSGTLKITSSTSLGAIVRLALVGYGICALPRAIISAEIARGDLVELNAEPSLPPIHFTSSHVSGTPNSSLVQDIGVSAAKFLDPQLIKNIYQN
ncbi:LysR family transcriptional regulator [Ahrensia sp. R2A130]|uniref:LysR family transcriptional regulator n=1 Tax=Ahrensia sp. R2A130 TaxID=744979 RepID=UPI0001E0D0E1|nr:LysR family transcriptional regulator [Ahrensia sp. R2A130]EFL89258.1 LysR family transcriptional regulator [Ahrensia sp. R2A130]